MKRRILFLQLPQLDNDWHGPSENIRLAAAYLQHTLQNSKESRYYESIGLPEEADRLDNTHLIEAILAHQPDVIAGTLYLWNVERALRVLAEIKALQPTCRILLGGPEVARSHPFLLQSRVPDVLAVGEGEPVFAAILHALRTGGKINLLTVAERCGKHLRFGKEPVQRAALKDLLPLPGFASTRTDRNGVAYMETTRGCSMRCAFCCYNQRRTDMSWLSAQDVLVRVRVLKAQGAREIRFIDPTFNSNPEFEKILRGLIRLNRTRSLRFFAELRGDTITEEHARLLARANVREIEIGLQSLDSRVLRFIGRPMPIAQVQNGVKLLARQGIRQTLDVMCGLPGQTMQDIKKALTWTSSIKGAQTQFLHTLLLPGTVLRDQSRKLGLKAQSLPPYRVLRTRTLTPDDLGKTDQLAEQITGRHMDSPTRRFVGRHLPDLFPEQISFSVDTPWPRGRPIPGTQIRRALLIQGENLFLHRTRIARIIRAALRQEPDICWQFVLCPRGEEPLDLLDFLIAVLNRHPPHIMDRLMVNPPGQNRRVARRLFIRLASKTAFSPSWIRAAEDLLSVAFR